MITPSPESFEYLQVERPVIGGGGEFLARATRVGRQVLGEKIIASMTEFGIEEVVNDGQLLEPVHQVTGLAGDVMRIGERNDLRMILLHRGAPAELKTRLSFGYHLGLLSARRRTVRGRINPDQPKRGKHILPGLTSELDQISSNHGENPKYMPINFDRVTILDEPGTDLVLGLLPMEQQVGTLVLHQQAQHAFGRLTTQSKRMAYPVSPGLVTIPFARIPGDIEGRQYKRLIEGLGRHLPHMFILGGIDYTGKVR